MQSMASAVWGRDRRVSGTWWPAWPALVGERTPASSEFSERCCLKGTTCQWWRRATQVVLGSLYMIARVIHTHAHTSCSSPHPKRVSSDLKPPVSSGYRKVDILTNGNSFYEYKFLFGKGNIWELLLCLWFLKWQADSYPHYKDTFWYCVFRLCFVIVWSGASWPHSALVLHCTKYKNYSTFPHINLSNYLLLFPLIYSENSLVLELF